MQVHVFTSDGGFVAGDSITGLTAYAYPTSVDAETAKRDAARIAMEMLNHEISHSYAHASESGKDYDRRNWKLLHDFTADHTTRAIIDAITQ